MLLGSGSTVGPVAAIMIGAVVCCAAAVAGDNLQDLKAGYLVGATPWRQQVMLAIGAISCALVMAPVLNLLTRRTASARRRPSIRIRCGAAGDADGVGSQRHVRRRAAVDHDVDRRRDRRGDHRVDEMLKTRGSKFRVPVLAVAVGIYLPLELTMPIFLGGLLAYFVERSAGKPANPADHERMHRDGVLFSAGLITGEALMGIVIAFFVWSSRTRTCWRCRSACSSAHGNGWASHFRRDRLAAVSSGSRRRAPRVQGRLAPASDAA